MSFAYFLYFCPRNPLQNEIMESITTRQLTPQEVAKLQEQGCSAEDWSTIYVTDEASLKYIRATRFSGEIHLGRFQKSFELPGGMHKHSGLFHATLHNVTIGDDCCIENIKN